MSKTVKGNKGPGYDYGGKRYGNFKYGQSPGAGVKRKCNRAERRISKQSMKDG